MNAAQQPYVEIDGEPATVANLLFPALVNYGHFTAMQVRSGRVRGLALHLRRLDQANRELFGAGLDGELVRDRIRHATAERPDASVRAVVFRAAPDAEVSVLVSVTPPHEFDDRPQSLRSVEYQRPAAHLKHIGGFGQIYHSTRARHDGYDDALLTDATGLISETAIANIGFRDGDAVLWPNLPALAGITMQLLELALLEAGVPVRRRPLRPADVESLQAAFVSNTLGIAPVNRIDDRRIAEDETFLAMICKYYDAVSWDRI
ncbi:branched-subunit amino acid aminotransferase/4-amino-4-deoxychorismate lyase [Allocatelliglobosispora scoriae]|uniref:Branched-subunit amino acid aminotransferase/4-amino-4-deoxychorismate lyase n=1 Tax=Allocatelliglobosispora scoriae TaxID=643052 RepID=A0A841BKK2_9ACTN|nr:aminotransferase class IV [Allocatelliglobosispora scoriae]MBB5867719.1 branched-subunit amino acid aminotransferase/4-amino-4-deoxychorismate lyase [Allocatelliglobosispora scoriae]